MKCEAIMTALFTISSSGWVYVPGATKIVSPSAAFSIAAESVGFVSGTEIIVACTNKI
jgi:hypothetical protein